MLKGGVVSEAQIHAGKIGCNYAKTNGIVRLKLLIRQNKRKVRQRRVKQRHHRMESREAEWRMRKPDIDKLRGLLVANAGLSRCAERFKERRRDDAADYSSDHPDIWIWIRWLPSGARLGILRWRRAESYCDNRIDSAAAARFLTRKAPALFRSSGALQSHSIGIPSMRYTSTVEGVVSFADSRSCVLCVVFTDCERQHEFPGTVQFSPRSAKAGDEQRNCDGSAVGASV